MFTWNSRESFFFIFILPLVTNPRYRGYIFSPEIVVQVVGNEHRFPALILGGGGVKSKYHSCDLFCDSNLPAFVDEIRRRVENAPEKD